MAGTIQASWEATILINLPIGLSLNYNERSREFKIRSHGSTAAITIEGLEEFIRELRDSLKEIS